MTAHGETAHARRERRTEAAILRHDAAHARDVAERQLVFQYCFVVAGLVSLLLLCVAVFILSDYLASPRP